MSIHILKIRPHFLEAIRSGKKTNEYRLATPERRKYQIGDLLVLKSNQDDSNFIKVKIRDIQIYKSWDEAFNGRWEEDFPGFSSYEDVFKECKRFYTFDEVKKNGIIVFKIEKCKFTIKKSRVLLDTNIIIQRESSTDVSIEVAQLQKYIDKLNVVKIYHPLTKIELSKYADIVIKNNLLKKIESYEELVPFDKCDAFFNEIASKYPQDENNLNDNKLLLQVYSGTVDFLITDDTGILNKAKELYLEDRVFSSLDFLNLVIEIFPSLVEYKVLSVKMRRIGELDVNDPFFKSLIEDYEGIKFINWFNKKNTEQAYVFEDKTGLQGFLYLKVEDEFEDFSDYNPILLPKKRLKVGTFKVNSTGFRLGERFLKIIFDNAKKNKVDEIYVTLFEDKRDEVIRLRDLMMDWGFYKFGKKISNGESVFVKDMKNYNPDKSPKFNYPIVKKPCKYGFLPIEAKYHTALFPDLFLKSEKMLLPLEKPCGYAIEKIYITHWKQKDLDYNPGDILVVYRKGLYGPKKYNSVVSGYVVLQEICYPKTYSEFKAICKNRTVFSEQELYEFYHGEKKYQTIIKVLFYHAFSRKIILQDLRKLNIVGAAEGPRLTTQITREQLEKIIELGEGKWGKK